mgnify:CR=1 FL=1
MNLENVNSQKEKDVRENEKINPIFTEVLLPKEENLNSDCGPLSIEMLILTDLKERESEYSLEKIKEGLKKAKTGGTMPGDMCKLLKKLGFDVEYFSTIDWEKCADENFENWDTKIKKVIETSQKFGFADLINKEGLKKSAEWLSKEGKDVITKKILSLKDIEAKLREGKRVIAIVSGGKHYVVITGIDEDRVYFNNPDGIAKKEFLSHGAFLNFWGKNIGTSETIVVSLPRNIK